MSVTSAVLGSGTEFEFEGRKYILSPWTFAIMAAFERHLEDEAFQAIHRLSKYLTPAEKAEQLATLARDVAAGKYTFGSPLVAEALEAKKHFSYLVYLMLRPNHPDISEEAAYRMVNGDPEQLYAKAAEANADPSPGAENKT
jgi:hypothetical protein